MKLRDGMLLYHDSYTPVEQIDLARCERYKDFGQGFYLSASPTQARNFIRSSLLKAQNLGNAGFDQDYGFVSSYRFRQPDHDLAVYEFNGTDRQWLWFIAQNRRGRLAKSLIPLIDKDVFSAEILIGKIANDTTNLVLTTYLNGLYGDVTSDRAVQFTVEQLMPERLDDQYCFVSEEAVACLEFIEARKYVIRR